MKTGQPDTQTANAQAKVGGMSNGCPVKMGLAHRGGSEEAPHAALISQRMIPYHFLIRQSLFGEIMTEPLGPEGPPTLAAAESMGAAPRCCAGGYPLQPEPGV